VVISLGEHVQTPDELEQDFTSNDFADIRAIHDQMLEESDIDWHKEVNEVCDKFSAKPKEYGNTSGFSEIKLHFFLYCLYKLVSEESKALKHARLAHKSYVKNTLSYQWESAAYRALKGLYGSSVVPDCILPNNKRPDLVLNPTYSNMKYHPKGANILQSEKIIDIKTSIYHTTKEKKYYQKYCEELVIVHLNELQAINTEGITYISAETLKNQLYDQSLIQEISGIQKKMDLDFLINDFDKRIAF